MDRLTEKLDNIHEQLVDPSNSSFVYDSNRKQAIKSLYKIIFAAEDMIKFLQEYQVYTDIIKTEKLYR